MKKIIQLSLMIFLTTVCVGQNKLKDYYYPITNKIEIKIFKYVDKNDSNNIEYWKVTTNPKTKKIKTVSYDSEFNIYNTFEEIITLTGAKLIKYADYEKNNSGNLVPNIAQIIDSNVFKWDGEKDYKYSVKYTNKYGSYVFSKKRTELGFENITVNNKEYETVKFIADYSFNDINKNDDYSFYQYSYYAKNIGMIKYRRYTPNKIIILELAELLNEEQFKKLKTNR
jgi:hypothetical protein|tara:strand:+ start:190 stop:867 length:678 start_codon:yes stop_codon:yes gene_type:complete